jgi:hypothetical protein
MGQKKIGLNPERTMVLQYAIIINLINKRQNLSRIQSILEDRKESDM